MEVRPESQPDQGALVSAGDWSRFLAERLDAQVEVVFGRSRTYPVQVRKLRDSSPLRPRSPSQAKGLQFTVRMHSMFAEAPLEVAESVAAWIRSGRRARRASALLDGWIEEATSALPARRVAPPRLAPRGNVYDLGRLSQELIEGLLAADFPAPDTLPSMTWGRRARSRTRRSLRLGSFDVEARLVRLHPVLDQAGVPEWFVRFVLFHELLHAALPPHQGTNGRWVHHGPAFRRRERAYPDYARATQWEEQNLPRLIRSARTGSALRIRDRIQGLFRFEP